MQYMSCCTVNIAFYKLPKMVEATQKSSFFITRTYTRFKNKIHNHQVRQVFRTWDIKQKEFVQRNCECEQQCTW